MFFVMFGLEPDISLTDSPVKPGNDEKEKKPGNDSIIFFPLSLSGLTRGLWIAVCKFQTTLGPFRPVGLELRL